MHFINLFFNLLYILRANQKTKYVFYSEKKIYQYHYLLLIEKILKFEDKEILYLSSDMNDKVHLPGVKNLYVGSSFFRILVFKIIKCKYFIMTITDLDNNELKKTDNIKYYIYLFHAANSAHKIYTKEAFFNYDIIFCNGDFHLKELRKMEKLYNLKKKVLVKSGYLYFEYLKNKIKKINKIHNKDITVLYAPSWNYSKNNIFNLHSLNLIENLIKKKINVIFRPHPEHFKRSKNELNRIVSKYKNNNLFSFDNDSENFKSLSMSDILITDYSGISNEFLFIFKKPVIYFNQYKKIHNQDFQEVCEETIEEKVLLNFGNPFNELDIENIFEKINFAILEFKNKEKKLDEFANKHFYNVNNASDYCADFLKEFDKNN